jgi:hypothetical protein
MLVHCAAQIINNIALNEFDVDVSKYTETLQKVIAACMDGVEPEEIINIVVESVTASVERVSGQRALQEGTDAISVSYEVQVDDPTKTFEMLSEELTTSVETGEFNTIMAETATETGATGLVDTTSDGVVIQDLLPTAEVAPTAAPTPNPQEMVLMFVEQVRCTAAAYVALYCVVILLTANTATTCTTYAANCQRVRIDRSSTTW